MCVFCKYVQKFAAGFLTLCVFALLFLSLARSHLTPLPFLSIPRCPSNLLCPFLSFPLCYNFLVLTLPLHFSRFSIFLPCFAVFCTSTFIVFVSSLLYSHLFSAEFIAAKLENISNIVSTIIHVL